MISAVNVYLFLSFFTLYPAFSYFANLGGSFEYPGFHFPLDPPVSGPGYDGAGLFQGDKCCEETVCKF